MKKRIMQLVAFLSCVVMAMSAQAQNLYWGGGTTDKADNTALPTTKAAFSGVWDTTTENWATSDAPGVYTSYAPGAFVDLGIVTDLTGNGGKVTITNQSDFSLSGLMTATKGDFVNQRIVLTATSPRTLTFTGPDCLLNTHAFSDGCGLTFEANVALAGTSTVHSTATYGLTAIKSTSDGLTGPVRVRNGTFTLDNGTLAGVTDLHLLTQMYLQSYSQSLSQPQLSVQRTTTSAKNQLNDDAVIKLTGGVFTYAGSDSATTPSSETLGKLVLEPYGRLALHSVWSGNAGAPYPKLILSDATQGIDRGANGRGTMMVNVTDATYYGAPIGYPTAELIVSNGVPTDVLLPWIAGSCGEFMRVNGTTKILEPVPSTPAPTDPNTWVAGTDYRCGSNSAWTATAVLANDLSVHALGFLPNTTCTLTIANDKTLTLASGALCRMAAQGVSKVTMITNGLITSGTSQLVITSEGIYGSFIIASRISGAGMELIKGGGNVTFAGPDSNTYNGTTYLSGPLTAAKTGSAIAIPGNLIIQNGGQFFANGTTPISSTSEVTIEEGGVWSHGAGSFVHAAPITIKGGCYYLQGQAPVFAASGTGLVFNGGRIVQYQSIYGSVSLQTDVSYAETSTKQARWEQLYTGTGLFGVELDGAQRTFAIADSATLADGMPEMVVDTRIAPGSPAGGSLRKTGAGILQLTDNNTYTGGTVVDGGTLHVAIISAPAQSNLTGVFQNSPCMVTFNQAVATNMVVRQIVRSASNTGLTAPRYITEIFNPYQLSLNSTGANARPTDIIADAITRSGSLGTGAATVNDMGTLKIDAGISLANTVTVNAGGTISASGAGIGSLTVNGGTVAANPSAGTLSVTNAVSLTDATLTLTGDVDNAPMTLLSATSISGKFASIPEKVSVRYYPTSITVERMKGIVIVVR